MHVIVVGAGVVGVSTAYYLNQAGCTVTVLERFSGVAQGASFGNAGVIAPGYVTPWAAPGMPRKVLAYLLKADAPVVFRPKLDWAMWTWLLRWFRECDLERFRVNRERMQRVAFYSRSQMHRLRTEFNLDYEQSSGYLQLFRSERDAALAQPAIDMLRERGVPHSMLDPNGCRAKEPGLSDMEFFGGLSLPEDESGNCPLFTRQLRDLAIERGVKFEFATPVLGVRALLPGVEVRTAQGIVRADHVVIASGVDAPSLLRPLGIRIPIYPVKGYSATVPIRETTYAPQGAVMDEAYKVAITRLGRRIRIAGTAEISGHGLVQREGPLRTLIKVARDWFPGAADFSGASYWAGARPMVPDGAPVLGGTSVPGVSLNIGHGSTGWAMACGSARIVADTVTGRRPEIDLEGLTEARYRG